MPFPRSLTVLRSLVSFLRGCGTPQNEMLFSGLIAGIYVLSASHQFLATFGTGLAAVTAFAVAVGVGGECGWKPGGRSHRPGFFRKWWWGHLAAAVWLLLLPWGLEAALQLAGWVPLEVMAAPGRLVLFEIVTALVLLSPLFFWVARCPWSGVFLHGRAPDSGGRPVGEKKSSPAGESGRGEKRSSRRAAQPGWEMVRLFLKPVFLLQSWWCQRRDSAKQKPWDEIILTRYVAGLMMGMAGGVLLLAPWWGLQRTVVAAALGGIGLFLVNYRRDHSGPASGRATFGRNPSVALPVSQTERRGSASSASAGISPDSSETFSPLTGGGRLFSRGERLSEAVVKGLLIAGLGGTSALVVRMLHQLAPVDVYVVIFQALALLGGVLWGMRVGCRRAAQGTESPLSPVPAVLGVTGTAVALLACFPAWISLTLWLNVYVTLPWLMMIARGALLAVFLIPLGYGWGRILSASFFVRAHRTTEKNRERAEEAGARSGQGGATEWPALQMFPFLTGYLLVRWIVLPETDPATALTVLQWGLLGTAGLGLIVRHRPVGLFLLFRNNLIRLFRKQLFPFRNEKRFAAITPRDSLSERAGWGDFGSERYENKKKERAVAEPAGAVPADSSPEESAAALSSSRLSGWCKVVLAAAVMIAVLAMPAIRFRYSPSRAARLLFATNVFIAKMKGLDESLLPFLDEGRLVAQQEGDNGTLTLWRYRGTQLQIRENGVPRALVSTRPDLCPQFSAEVMPAVLPLVLHPQPHRVLLLGLGGGVSLNTTLSFPVKAVTCVEEDSRLLRLLREKVWSESRQRPETDLRLRLLNVPPTMAVVCGGPDYDVIISTPPPSMLLKSSGQFTEGFYRRLAARLSRDGIFCQRFHQVDYGPQPLQMAAKTLQSVFRYVAAIEIAGGEMALLATNSPEGLVREGLLERFQLPHVRTVLSRLGWDWSLPLNLTAFSHEGLKQMAVASGVSENTAANGFFTFRLPQEVIRWAPKWQEMVKVTAAHRTRFLEAEGIDGNNPVLLRRLAELTGQRQLMLNYPDQWWSYRKSLKEQLRKRPRTLMTSVASGRSSRIHPEDRHRLSYFRQLARAAEDPTPESIRRVAAFTQPYDPLLSYFVHQEVAALYERSHPRDVRAELWHRLHAVYYALPRDRSVRDVSQAMSLLAVHPEILPQPADRWDHLNALLQILKTRWTTRGLVAPRSPQIVLNDIDESLEAVDAALQTLSGLYGAVGFSAEEWAARRRVLEQALRRPLRDYRARLLKRHRYERRRIRELLRRLEEDSRPKSPAGDGKGSTPDSPANPSRRLAN